MVWLKEWPPHLQEIQVPYSWYSKSSSSFNKGTTFAAVFVSVAGSTIVKESKRDRLLSEEGYVSKEVCNEYI
jgi:hypothetical protein